MENILVVDDEEKIARVISAYLQKEVLRLRNNDGAKAPRCWRKAATMI